MKVKTNDNVIVLSGNYKGKIGKILKVFPKKDKIIVKGVNVVKCHIKSSTKNNKGTIIKKEAPIHVSNVSFLDPKKFKPSRLGYKFIENKKNRISKKSNKIVNNNIFTKKIDNDK